MSARGHKPTYHPLQNCTFDRGHLWDGDEEIRRDLYEVPPNVGLLSVLLQPALHQSDLALLRLNDLFGEFPHLGIFAEGEHRLRHIEGASMMRNHAFDEVDICVAGEGNVHGAVHLRVDAMERKT